MIRGLYRLGQPQWGYAHELGGFAIHLFRQLTLKQVRVAPELRVIQQKPPDGRQASVYHECTKEKRGFAAVQRIIARWPIRIRGRLGHRKKCHQRTSQRFLKNEFEYRKSSTYF